MPFDALLVVEALALAMVFAFLKYSLDIPILYGVESNRK